MNLDDFIKQAVAQSRELKKKKGTKQKLTDSTQKALDEAKKVLEEFHKAQLDLKWKDHAVVMMVNRITCKCCGASFTTPNGHVFLKRENKILGIHYKAIDQEVYGYRHLPKITELREDTAPCCPACFPACAAELEAEQLALFNEEKGNGTA